MSSVNFSELLPARSADEYRLHCAAVEWSLTDPIIINSADEIKSRADWSDKLQPFHHQVQNLLRFCRRLPVTLLADDVGLGKTISAGLIISELMKRGRVSRVFVICPKILISQWTDELASKFGIEARGATGPELDDVARRTEPVIVTTYQSATKFLVKKQAGIFDMLILDEAHKVRNLHGTAKPPKMATAIHQALESRMFRYVLMLTATPIQNRLWDIYSLVECLAVGKGHRNPFGSPEDFASRYLADGKVSARKLEERHAEEFRQIVRSYMSRTRREDAKLAFPERDVRLYRVQPSVIEARIHRLVAAAIIDFNPLVQISILVALMSSPQALAAQLENMIQKDPGCTPLAVEVRRLADELIAPAKTQSVIAIADDLRGQRRSDWRMVIFTTRKETQRMLANLLKQKGIRCGLISGGEPVQNRKSVAAFCKPEPDINVLVSTDAGAEGVNLQAGNILVNYDLPWNPMIVEQRIGRVQRIGSKFKKVWVANVVHANSPEERIVGRLMEKLQVISHTVGDIESVLEATGDDGDGGSFENQIRDMVIRSMQGQDMSEATRLAEQSIEDAKKLFEQQQHEMDDKLGAMGDDESDDLPMPRVKPTQPSMSVRDFVTAAIELDGGSVTEEREHLYRVSSKQAYDEQITFDKATWQQYTQGGVFMGRAPLFFSPGAPAFERLVQKWCDRAGFWLDDETVSDERAQEAAMSWLDSIPSAELVSTSVANRINKVQISLLCRARVANSVDSFEKLIQVDSTTPVAASYDEVVGENDVSVLFRSAAPRVSEAVSADAELRQFRQYYEERLDRELKRSDSGSRQTSLISDLLPNSSTEIVGASGQIAGTVAISISYRFGQSPTYTTRLEVLENGELDSPPQGKCELTGEELPLDCLAKCEVTGKQALRHLLVRSEQSGSLAISDHIVHCEESGKQVLSSETEKCSITGKRVASNLLVSSAISGRKAIPAGMEHCEVTGAAVLADELRTCSRTGKKIRADEAVTVQPSGATVHKGEAAFCGYSNHWCLLDDCERSDITGQPVLKSEVLASEKSGRKGHPSELVRCESTNKYLLSDEVVTCSVTNKTVDKDLTRVCPESEKPVLDSELVPCELTGVRVAPFARVACETIGKKVRQMLTAVSAASGRFGLRQQMVRCEDTKALLLPDEVDTCQFSGKVVDKRRLSGCKLTGLRLSTTLLNQQGEFRLLRQCLDEEFEGEVFSDQKLMSQFSRKVFFGVKDLRLTTSATAKSHILFGSKSLFGFKRKRFAVVANEDEDGFGLAGRVVFAEKHKGKWVVTETIDTEDL